MAAQRNVRSVFAPERERTEGATRTLRHELSPRTVFVIVGIVAAIWLLARVWESLLIFVIALVLAGTFSPVVTRMERRGLPRAVALGVVFIALLGVVVGLGLLVLPAFAAQIGQLVVAAPSLQGQVAEFVRNLPFGDRFAGSIRTYDPGQLLEPVGASALDTARAVAGLIVIGVTVVVLAFYLIADHERMQGFLFSLLPRTFHLRTAHILLDMETVVGGYMRGQAITSVCIGVVTFVVCTVAGVENSLAVAVFAAFADLVPFVGPALAIAPPVLLAFAHGPTQGIGVFIALLAYSQIETHVLVPRIYGQSLRLSPVAVVMALIIGGQLLGIVGSLLALPIAAGLRVLVEDLRIELPGEVAGEASQRAAHEAAEAEYAAETATASSAEASVIATEMAEQLQGEVEEATGLAEFPAEEQGDPPLKPLPLRNPARL